MQKRERLDAKHTKLYCRLLGLLNNNVFCEFLLLKIGKDFAINETDLFFNSSKWFDCTCISVITSYCTREKRSCDKMILLFYKMLAGYLQYYIKIIILYSSVVARITLTLDKFWCTDHIRSECLKKGNTRSWIYS